MYPMLMIAVRSNGGNSDKRSIYNSIGFSLSLFLAVSLCVCLVPLNCPAASKYICLISFL